MLLLIIGGAASVAGLFALYLKMTMGMCHSKKDLTGRVVIVTGGNCGIGLETARNMVRRNAKVILACRDTKKGEDAAKDILASTGMKSDALVVRQLDLCSFSSVREFADQILRSETRLDILINNAGIMYRSAKELTKDGIDTIMAANHFGHFLLTNLLLPLLKKNSSSRIVVVSSELHRYGAIDFDDLKAERNTAEIGIYNNSKLANVLFALEMSQRLKGSGVTVNSLHPGVVSTRLVRDLNPVMRIFFPFFKGVFTKTPEQGAQTSISCAVAEELEGVTGKYFSDCKEISSSARAKDLVVARKLWERSVEITGFQEK